MSTLTLDQFIGVATKQLAKKARDDMVAERKAGKALAARPDPLKTTLTEAEKKAKKEARKTARRGKGAAGERPPRPAWAPGPGMECKHCGKGAASGSDKGHWNSGCPDKPASTPGHAKMGRGDSDSESASDDSGCESDPEVDDDSELDQDEALIEAQAKALFAQGPTAPTTAPTTVAADASAAAGSLLSELTALDAAQEAAGRALVARGDAALAEATGTSVPMGTPVSARILRSQLNAESPLKDIKAYIDSSPDPAVRSVSKMVGGSLKRNRQHILADVDAAERPAVAPAAAPTAPAAPPAAPPPAAPPAAPPPAQLATAGAAPSSPDYSPTSSDDSDHEPPAPAPPSAPPPPPPAPPPPPVAREAEYVPHLGVMRPPVPPVPPLVANPAWAPRVRFRQLMTQLYQLSNLEGPHVIAPPQMRSSKGGSKNAFYHRDHHREPLYEFCRGTRGKACIFTRDFLAGSGRFHAARAEHPAKGSDNLLDCLRQGRDVAQEILSAMPAAGDDQEDVNFWALGDVLEHDLLAAYDSAQGEPLAYRLGIPMSPVATARIDRLNRCASLSYHLMMLGLAVAVASYHFGAPSGQAALRLIDPGTTTATDPPLSSPDAPEPLPPLCCLIACHWLLGLTRLRACLASSARARQAEGRPRATSPPNLVDPSTGGWLFSLSISSGLGQLASCGATLACLPFFAAAKATGHLAPIGIALDRTLGGIAEGDLARVLHAIAPLCSRIQLRVRRIRHATSPLTSACWLAICALGFALASSDGYEPAEIVASVARQVKPQERPRGPPRRRYAHARRRWLRSRRHDAVHSARSAVNMGKSRSSAADRRSRRRATLQLLDRCARVIQKAWVGRFVTTRLRHLRRERAALHIQLAWVTARARAASSADGRACLGKAEPRTINTKCTVGNRVKSANAIAKALKARGEDGSILLVLDSGCTWNCHPHKEDLVNFRPHRQRMFGIDGASCQVTGIGDLPVIGRDEHGNEHSIVLKNVRCVPSFTDSLISVEQIYTELKAEARFGGRRKIYISPQSPDHHLRGLKFPFKHFDGLFQWPVIASARCPGKALVAAKDNVTESTAKPGGQVHSARSTAFINAMPADDAVALLHRRLHVNQDTIRKLSLRTADVPAKVANGHAHSCASCLEANATKLPHHAKPSYKPSHVGRLVHADIVGPFVATTVGSYKYMLVLVDDHSRFITVHHLAKKSDAPRAVRKYVANLNGLASAGKATPVRVVGHLHSDNAGEFLSREFTDFLDSELIDHTTCPPHVHSLNGIAERAIRTVVENMRSNLQASNMPVRFWNFAADHAVDVLNRVHGPPKSNRTAYRIVTGKRPRVLGIWPLGCRAYPVRPRHQYKKTFIEPHAWSGMNLGRCPTIPGGYSVWLPNEGKVVTTSDVWFDETLMPWRPRGDQRVGMPPPTAAEDDGQPPGLPRAAPADVPPPPVPAAESLTSAFIGATRGASGPAASSRRALILFSGPQARPDGLAAFLSTFGIESVMMDNHPVDGGGESENLLNATVYNSILNRAKAGEFLAIFAAPPCSSFSISRHIKPRDGSVGPEPLRLRGNPHGITNLTGARRRELVEANMLVQRTVAIIAAGNDAGTQYILENPSDRGILSDGDLFIDEQHAPLWVYPPVVALRKATDGRAATFPQCAFGADWQKFTTLVYSPGLEKWLGPLTNLRCPHSSHAKAAGGTRKDDGSWSSLEAAAYPADMNYYIASAIRCLADDGLPPALPDAHRGRGSNQVPSSAARQATQPEKPTGVAASVSPATAQPPAPRPRPASPQQAGRDLSLDLAKAATDPADTVPAAVPTIAANIVKKVKKNEIEQKRVHFRPARPTLGVGGAGARVAGSPIRLRSDRALLCFSAPWTTERPTALAPPHVPQTRRARALAAQAACDPKNRLDAMARDREGWTAAELDELRNHSTNKSWTVLDRSKLPRGRRLVKTVWVYKVKRSGKLKARLCVQGCSQVPGVDYDQTHCSTMRSSTLRALSACATHLDLAMRRWDFVSAYLQGELLEGEVVYCLAPPGHETLGKDGLQQIIRVDKPIYGMAQAGRRWQRSLYPWLAAWGLTPAHADPNVFQCKRTVDTPDGPREERLIIGCYVDDLFTLYSHDDEHSLYRKFIHDLNERWNVEDEGEVTDLLGIEIERDGNTISLKQTAYIDRLVDKWLGSSVENFPVKTSQNKVPASTELPQLVADALADVSERPLERVREFQAIVGSLLYAATNTRPDIAYAVGMLCRAMTKPTPQLMDAALQVVSYLRRTREIGLRYEATTRPVYGLSDSDWAVKHSTTGWVFMYGSAAISWSSKKQDSVALSSCEAEIMALSEAAKEALHLDTFMSELDMKGDQTAPLDLSTDNTGARDLAYNPEHHQKVKHIERRHFFIRECVENMRINVPYVNTMDNYADFFTKPLSSKPFYAFRNVIMNVPPCSARDEE